MSKTYFTALDSMRGLSAVFVAIFHFSTISFIGSIPFIRNGFLFVDFFFVLSGFVIAASYEEKLRGQFPITRFMFLRLGRLYPLHICVLLLYVIIAILKPDSDYSAYGFVVTALLLQTFTDGNLTNWNLPSWSISAEIWAYVTFAVLCKSMPRLLVTALLLVVFVSPFALLMFSDRYIDVCFSGSLLRCLFGFSVGALGYMTWRRYKLPLGRWTFTVLEVISLAASLTIVSLAGAGPLSLACPFVFVVAIVVLATEGGLVSQLLRTAPFALIGNLSYSIYMTHMFIQALLLNIVGMASSYADLPITKHAGGTQTIENASGFAFASDVTIPLMLIVVIGCSVLSHRFIEDPARRFSKESKLFLARR